MAIVMFVVGALAPAGHARVHGVDEAAAWAQALEAERLWLESGSSETSASVFVGFGEHRHGQDGVPSGPDGGHSHHGFSSHSVAIVQSSGIEFRRFGMRIAPLIVRSDMVASSEPGGLDRPPRA
jgi:hypothetical protein